MRRSRKPTDRLRLGHDGQEFRVRRHPRSRRITLRVHDDELIVTAPPYVSERELRTAVAARADWVTEALARSRATRAAPLLAGDRIPVLGGSVALIASPRRRARRTSAGLEVPGDTPLGPVVETWYRSAARAHFNARVAAWAPRIGVAPTGISIRDQRTRWGSASAAGRLSFNWRLMMAGPDVAEYVTVHELVHLRHMDHSPAFWRCVAEHWPAYGVQRDWLRVHGARLQTGPHPEASGPG